MVNCLDLHMYHCATVSASNLKSLFVVVDEVRLQVAFIRFVTGPARTRRQHIKMPRKHMVATATKYRQANGGNQDTRRFYRSVAAATLRHRQPKALPFVVVIRSSIISRRRRRRQQQQQRKRQQQQQHQQQQQQQPQQKHHKENYGAASRITDCTT